MNLASSKEIQTFNSKSPNNLYCKFRYHTVGKKGLTSTKMFIKPKTTKLQEDNSQ